MSQPSGSTLFWYTFLALAGSVILFCSLIMALVAVFLQPADETLFHLLLALSVGYLGYILIRYQRVVGFLGLGTLVILFGFNFAEPLFGLAGIIFFLFTLHKCDELQERNRLDHAARMREALESAKKENPDKNTP